MIAYIPKADSLEVEDKTLKALQESSIISDIVIHSTPKFFSDYRRYKAIGEACLDCYKMAIEKGEEFFVMCNASKLSHMIPKLESVFEYMRENSKCGMGAYNPYKTKRNPLHVCAGLAIHRVEAIENVKLAALFTPEYKLCHCLLLCRELRVSGWEASYISKNLGDV